MAESEPGFARLQRAFAHYLRDPVRNPAPPGVTDPRIAIYANVVFANMRALFDDNFPIMSSVLGAERFTALVRAFFAGHRSYEPAMARFPREFVQYLREERNETGDPPYLAELADFEWSESDLGADPTRTDWSGIDLGGDLLAGIPRLNPVARLARYRYPVHLLGTGAQPEPFEPRATTLLLFRDLDDRFGVIELNPVAARLFDLAHAGTQRSGRELLTVIAWELQHRDPDVVIRGGLEILERWRARGVVLGTRQAAVDRG